MNPDYFESHICSELCADLLAKIVRKIIPQLRTVTVSFYNLANLWEDLCLCSAIGQESPEEWDMIKDTLLIFAEDEANKLTLIEKQLISHDSEELYQDEEIDNDFYDHDRVVESIYHMIIDASHNYSNKNIRKMISEYS